jgi:hypothetical protein
MSRTAYIEQMLNSLTVYNEVNLSRRIHLCFQASAAARLISLPYICLYLQV